MTFAEGENSKKQLKCSCNWFIAPISVAKMGTVAIGIGIGTCIGLRVGSVETVLHITIYSTIHKAAGRHSAGSWNEFCRLHSRLMGVSGIVPGKIMERPGTVRPTAL